MGFPLAICLPKVYVRHRPTQAMHVDLFVVVHRLVHVFLQ